VTTVSNARIKTWRRCPKKYEFRYVMGLRPKRLQAPLERGSWVHELLMYHYDGEDWKEKHAENTDAFNNLFEEEREDLGDLPAECERIMRSYLRHYRDEDKHEHTVDSELDEILTMPNGLEFNFIIDRIYEDRDGGLWLQDHKTVSRWLPPDFMLLDAQLTRYFWCAEKMGYTPLMGVEFNQIRTKAPTVPSLLQSGELSQRMNIDTDYWTYLRAIKQHELDPKDYKKILEHLWAQEDSFFRRSRMPRDKPVTDQMMDELFMSVDEIVAAEKHGAYPRTVMKECTWDCPYLEPCVIQLQGGDISSIVKMNYVVERKDNGQEA
jgi:hypothetical protein